MMSSARVDINTSNFTRISLQESEKAQLMQRIDSKFIINIELAKDLLLKVTDNYYVVDNNGQVIPEYISDYYDTSDFKMYLDHQNRRPKRYKIRVRNYCASGDSFLEIKIRVPSGKTIKRRIPATNEEINKTNISEFISNKSPYSLGDLSKTLETRFNRLTLVSKEFDERITFDFNLLLTIPNTEKLKQYENICIIEVKRSKHKSNSEISQLLKQLGIRPMGFSKYSIGCALLYPKIKSNNFKKTFLHIKKLQNEYTQPYNAVG